VGFYFALILAFLAAFLIFSGRAGCINTVLSISQSVALKLINTINI
jgi:hypothetical protein